MAGLFDPKTPGGLNGLLGLMNNPPPSTPPRSGLFGLLSDPPPPPGYSRLSDLGRVMEPRSSNTAPFGLLAGRGLFSPPPPAPTPPLRAPAPAPAPIKRRTYFAFHFEDSFRVNNVRQA